MENIYSNWIIISGKDRQMKLILQIAIGYLLARGIELMLTYFFAFEFATKMAQRQLGMA